jgi:hypothetical protein
VSIFIPYYVCYDNHNCIDQEALDVQVGIKVAVERKEMIRIRDMES